MNWEAIGAVGEILGALGVIATLIYLALQIRQNTRSIQANRLNEIGREFAERHMVVATSSEMPRIAANCRKPRSDDFSPEDQERVLAWVNSQANTYFTIAVAHQNGELSDDVYKAYCQDVHRIVGTYPGALPEWHIWCDYYPLLRQYKIFNPLFDGTFPG